MAQLPANPEVVVIGAGAAGIGAGLALARAGVSFLIVEAKQRVGGRAYTDVASIGHLWDHGCHWFHSADRNVLRRLADKLGHGYRQRPRVPVVRRYLGGRWLMSPFEGDFVWESLAAIPRAGRSASDKSASEVLDRAHPWYPLIHHWVTLMYSVEPEQVSTLDAARYEDSHVNLPVSEGYGALIAKLACGLPIRTATAVRSLTASNGGVSVGTEAGSLQARAVIAAVPARIFETGRLSIRPALPAALEQAFHDVPMGWYEKVAIAFDEPLLEASDLPYADIFDPSSPASRPLNFEIHPFGRPIAVAHIAGDLARELSAKGEAEMVAFALDALIKAFGSQLRRRITATAVTGWSSDPHIGGAYSCAKPGCADARRRFAEPVHERILLAGEHVHQSAMATAHGAFESGIAAAYRAMRLIGAKAPPPDPLWLPTKQMDMGVRATYMTASDTGHR